MKPKDSIKIGTKEEALWAEIRDVHEDRVMKNKINIEIDEVIFNYAKQKVLDEKKK